MSNSPRSSGSKFSLTPSLSAPFRVINLPSHPSIRCVVKLSAASTQVGELRVPCAYRCCPLYSDRFRRYDHLVPPPDQELHPVDLNEHTPSHLYFFDARPDARRNGTRRRKLLDVVARYKPIISLSKLVNRLHRVCLTIEISAVLRPIAIAGLSLLC